MTLTNSQDLLFFILAVAAVWIGVMLTWLLFEAALMAHRANRAVKDVLEKLGRFERAVMSIRERIESSASYFSMFAEGGKALVGFLQDRSKTKKSRRRRKDDEDDEDEE